jgi:hypothetical protein
VNGTVSVLPSSIEREGLESKEKFIGVTKISSGEILDALHHIRYIALQHHSLMFSSKPSFGGYLSRGVPRPGFFLPGCFSRRPAEDRMDMSPS